MSYEFFCLFFWGGIQLLDQVVSADCFVYLVYGEISLASTVRRVFFSLLDITVRCGAVLLPDGENRNRAKRVSKIAPHDTSERNEKVHGEQP